MEFSLHAKEGALVKALRCRNVILVLGVALITFAHARAQPPRRTELFIGPPVATVAPDRGMPLADFVVLTQAEEKGTAKKLDEKAGVLPKELVDPKAFTIIDDDPSPFRGRLSLRGDVGDGVGYTRGFAYAEGMLPVSQTRDTLLFADVRLVNFLQENRWEYNLGGGDRWYSAPACMVFGVNSFYDARKTDFHYY